jgi:hypothetical protein
MKTNLTLNDMGGATQWRPMASSPWSTPLGASCSLPRSSSSMCKVIIVLFWVTIGFTPIGVCLLLCTSFGFSGSMTRSKWYTRTHRLTLLFPLHWPTGSMGAPSAYQGEIFQATTFLASPRMDLYMCLYS